MIFVITLFFIAFAVFAILALFYMVFMFWSASEFKRGELLRPIMPSAEGVTVLIPFRNEALHLEKCLDAFVHQNQVSFPYQILLINDGSDDQSEAIISPYFKRLPIQLLDAEGTGKKAALQTGIKAAQYPIVYTLDADCVLKPNTLATMHNIFVSENLNMLCGLVNLAPAKAWFQNLQAAESAALVGISAVMLNAHKPATCNGANLMFKKEVFLQLKGYDHYQYLSSGDDDFLMHAFFSFNPHACRYTMHPDALVETMPEHSLRSFFAQRARWASKRGHYIFPYNKYLFILLGLKFMTYWVLLFLVLIWSDHTALILFLMLYVAEFALARRLRAVLKFNYLSVLLLPLYQFYLPLVLIYGKFFRIHWKGRLIQTK